MPGLAEDAIRQSPLWNHMAKVLSHIVSERPAEPLEAMGPTSHFVLRGDALPPKTATSLYAEVRPTADTDVPADALVNTRWAANMTRTLAPAAAPRRPRAPEDEDGEDGGGGDMDDGEPSADDPAFAPTIVQRQLADAEADAAAQGSVADIVAEQRVFNSVGVGLPPEEAFRLAVGLKQLLRSEPLATVRFWGKVMGSGGDYYVAEATLDPSRLPENGDGDEDDDDGGDYGEDEDGLPLSRVAAVLAGHVARRRRSISAEEAGTGLNERVYYAASTGDPTAWSRLPDVSPEHIVTARKIRGGFTGDLEAAVYSHPRFPGRERHYLRAQIARIACACRVAPRDVFVTEGAVPDEGEEDEDGNPLPVPAVVPAYQSVPPLLPQEAPDEEDLEAVQAVDAWFHGYAHGELAQDKHWAHIAPTLLACGRVTVAPAHGGGNNDGGEGQDNGADDDDDLTAADPLDDEDAAAAAAGLREELINPFLSDLSKDAPLAFPGHSRHAFRPWNFRQAYVSESSRGATYLARSVLWPGGYTYATTARGEPGARHESLYIGSGLKSLQGAVYSPQLPPRRMAEYPEDGLVLRRDCTIDEELAYAPAPARADEESELDEEGEDAAYDDNDY